MHQKIISLVLVAGLLVSCSPSDVKDLVADSLSESGPQQSAPTTQTSDVQDHLVPGASDPTVSWTNTPTFLPATPTDVPTSTPEATLTPTPVLESLPSPTSTLSSVVNWDEAGKYVGEDRIVCGPVKGTHYAKSSNGKPTFLNVGEDYPSPNRFTVLIWGEDRANFPSEPEIFYAEKNICASGEIQEYQGAFEIVVRSPEEITLQESSD